MKQDIGWEEFRYVLPHTLTLIFPPAEPAKQKQREKKLHASHRLCTEALGYFTHDATGCHTGAPLFPSLPVPLCFSHQVTMTAFAAVNCKARRLRLMDPNTPPSHNSEQVTRKQNFLVGSSQGQFATLVAAAFPVNGIVHLGVVIIMSKGRSESSRLYKRLLTRHVSHLHTTEHPP